MNKDKHVKVTRDLLDLRNRYRRTINDLESSIGEIMSVGGEMVKVIKNDPNFKKYATYLTKILKNMQSMHEMINKIYSNKSMINPEPIYVDKSIEYIVNEKKSLPQFSHIGFDQEYKASDVKMVIDRTEFEEMIKHILNNAQEAINGNGKITVKTSSLKENKQIRIDIVDNGCGITNTIRPHIFTRYFTTKEGKEGIGLTVAHDTIQAYNGSIDVESRGEGQGCVTTIIMPENLELYDEVKYYKTKFYFSKRVEKFVKEHLLGWGDDKVSELLEHLVKLDPGYQCLTKEQVNILLNQKKTYFLGRAKQ